MHIHQSSLNDCNMRLQNEALPEDSGPNSAQWLTSRYQCYYQVRQVRLRLAVAGGMGVTQQDSPAWRITQDPTSGPYKTVFVVSDALMSVYTFLNVFLLQLPSIAGNYYVFGSTFCCALVNKIQDTVLDAETCNLVHMSKIVTLQNHYTMDLIWVRV